MQKLPDLVRTALEALREVYEQAESEADPADLDVEVPIWNLYLKALDAYDDLETALRELPTDDA